MGLSSFPQKLSYLIIIDTSIYELFLVEKIISKLLGRYKGEVKHHPLSRRREYIQKPESVKAKMNGQSTPGLDGFWFLDDRLTSGKRVGVEQIK